MRDDAKAAAKVLGLALDDVTHDSLRAAYRRLSKECHPDSQAPDAERWAQISAARGVLERWLNAAAVAVYSAVKDTYPTRCRPCGGMGFTRARSGLRLLCKFCAGTGCQ